MRPFRAALPALIALSPASHDGIPLFFEPAPESTRALEIESVLRLDGGELSCVMDGSEVPGEYLPDLHLRLQDRRRLVLTETRVEGGAGERVSLRRFDELLWENEGSMAMSMQGEDQEWPWSASGTSPFEGRTLRIAREVPAEGGAPGVTLADGGAPLDLPAGLGADLGFGALLGDEAPALGTEWKVDGAALGELFQPGDDLAWDLPAEMAEHLLVDYDERSFEGTLTLVLAEVVEQRARITVQGELVRITVQPGDLSQVPVVDGTATDTIEDTWQVEGELEWDLAANQLAELGLAGDWSSATTTVRDPDQPGSTYESVFTVEGSYSLSVRGAATEVRVAEAAGPR